MNLITLSPGERESLEHQRELRGIISEVRGYSREWTGKPEDQAFLDITIEKLTSAIDRYSIFYHLSISHVVKLRAAR